MRISNEVLSNRAKEGFIDSVFHVFNAGKEDTAETINFLIDTVIVGAREDIEIFQYSNNPVRLEVPFRKSIQQVMRVELLEEAVRLLATHKEEAEEIEEVVFVNNTTVRIPKKYQEMLEEVSIEFGGEYWAYCKDGYEFGNTETQTAHDYTQADLLKSIRTLRKVEK